MGTSASPAASSGRSKKTEWPTVLLLAVIVALFMGVTWFHDLMSAPVFVIAVGLVVAWWSSAQHELLHGHPFANQRINDAIGHVTMNLWLPFPLYKSSHLEHHRIELTDPLNDPESFYCTETRWESLNSITRGVLWVNRTLLGRFVIGPVLVVPAYCGDEIMGMIKRRDRVALNDWLRHIAFASVTAVWLFGICKVPVGPYLLGAVWLAMSLIMIRSFAEHRWVPGDASRSAMVNASWPFALLFLNNNLHHTHHARPSVAWYKLPGLASTLDSSAKAHAGAGLYRGYLDLARKFLVRPFDGPVHPAEPLGAAMRAARSPMGVADEGDTIDADFSPRPREA